MCVRERARERSGRPNISNRERETAQILVLRATMIQRSMSTDDRTFFTSPPAPAFAPPPTVSNSCSRTSKLHVKFSHSVSTRALRARSLNIAFGMLSASGASSSCVRVVWCGVALCGIRLVVLCNMLYMLFLALVCGTLCVVLYCILC